MDTYRNIKFQDAKVFEEKKDGDFVISSFDQSAVKMLNNFEFEMSKLEPPINHGSTFVPSINISANSLLIATAFDLAVKLGLKPWETAEDHYTFQCFTAGNVYSILYSRPLTLLVQG